MDRILELIITSLMPSLRLGQGSHCRSGAGRQARYLDELYGIGGRS
jgi:hypothetical protein